MSEIEYQGEVDELEDRVDELEQEVRDLESQLEDANAEANNLQCIIDNIDDAVEVAESERLGHEELRVAAGIVWEAYERFYIKCDRDVMQFGVMRDLDRAMRDMFFVLYPEKP